MKHKLSKRADTDLKKIYKYTYKTFGEKQADKYSESLEQCFMLLANTPTLGRRCDSIKPGLFRHEHQSHTIFYRIKSNHIFIVRLLHEDMDPAKHF